jgi:hypothetical protein
VSREPGGQVASLTPGSLSTVRGNNRKTMSKNPSPGRYCYILVECIAAAAFAVLIGVVFAASPRNDSSFKSFSSVIGDYILASGQRK